MRQYVPQCTTSDYVDEAIFPTMHHFSLLARNASLLSPKTRENRSKISQTILLL